MRFPESRRFPAAVLAGACLALAFPLPGWAGLAWAAPGILFAAGAGLKRAEAFRVGYVAGLAWFLISLRWLLAIPHPAGSIAAWLALSAYCAVYPATWLLVARFRAEAPVLNAPDLAIEAPTPGGWTESVAVWTRQSWWSRCAWMLGSAAAWVVLEMARGWVIGGFPWILLGVSQYQSVPLIQFSAWTGVYGVSFLICWGSLSLVSACATIASQPRNRWAWTGELRLPLLTVLALGGLGVRRVMSEPAETEFVRLALVQPSVPQTLIWDRAADSNRFERVRELSVQALREPVDALVWPEGSLPDINRDQFEGMVRLTRAAGVPWIFGTDDSDEVDGRARYFNSAFMLDAEGRRIAIYRKKRLVIFGEFVPFERWLPFLRWLTPIGGSFTAGEGPVAFPLDGGRARASPVICFEDVFPDGTRVHALVGADFLLELTNDGWFGEGSGQWQHLANALFRAVENGVPLVRCTNNGVTGWIDRHGRLREYLGSGSGACYSQGILRVSIPLGGAIRSTFYRTHGDVFGFACCAGAVLFALRSTHFGRRCGTRMPKR